MMKRIQENGLEKAEIKKVSLTLDLKPFRSKEDILQAKNCRVKKAKAVALYHLGMVTGKSNKLLL